MPVERIPCPVCKDVPKHGQVRTCRECFGVGYFEHYSRLPGCNKNYPTCPIENEPAVGGWMCTYCGDSGPL